MENRKPTRGPNSEHKRFTDSSRSGRATGVRAVRVGENSADTKRRYSSESVQSRDRTGRFGRVDPHAGRTDRGKLAGLGSKPRKGVGKGRKADAVARTKKLREKPLVTSDLQVTDGKFRAKLLQNSVSAKATPTGRRLREQVFRVLSRRVRAGRFLDLGAGMGTMGIEAISRGAMLSTFVERSARMATFIRKNLAELEIRPGHGEVVEMEILPFLKQMSKRRRFWDIVYFGAFNDTSGEEILRVLGRGASIRPGGILLIEHHSDIKLPEKLGLLRHWRTVTHAEFSASLFERK